MKDIKGYEGLYAVTSCGRVWSYRSQRFLKSRFNRGGYEYVILSVGNQRKTLTIHRLVAEAYIPNPLGLPEVNHKDEIKSHNYINNLEWCDKTYNINYGTRTKRTSKAVYCVELNRVFESTREAERETGASHNHISYCCSGKQKTCGGYHWRYCDE